MRGVTASCAAISVRNRRGVSVILVVVCLVAVLAFVSLAIDMGRVRLAKAEMQTVADAAARAGAISLPVNTAAVIDQATDVADRNPVLDTEKFDKGHLGMRINPGVELEADEDIHFGIWDTDTRVFTEIFDDTTTPNRDERGRANAVQAI